LFVLEGAFLRFPEVAERGYLMVTEPNGSMGAPLLMEALPESRMIFLVRDPRDVVASFLDARKEGSWLHNYGKGADTTPRNRNSLPDDQSDTFMRTLASNFVTTVKRVKEAYEAHEGHKVLVKYEDLRCHTLETMKRIYSELGIAIDEEELARTVEKISWENLPKEMKGAGKFFRKATPGGWKEDLTPEQAKVVEEITAPILSEYYPDSFTTDEKSKGIDQ
jgi:hypothetical protein